MFSPTFIAVGTHIKGKFVCNGDCVVQGRVTGEIFSKETVLIKKGGSFEGYVHAPLLVVQGLCKGIIHCDNVEILPQGEIRGDIQSHALIMHRKALFEGTRVCVAKTFNHETEHKKHVDEFDTEDILL
ncbi:MAG: polymer-forming cytoskeletal protein [Campylobacterales bacterium]|nr:polymer-forming cytoskeletal protein [Campylobacterales bacterium]